MSTDPTGHVAGGAPRVAAQSTSIVTLAGAAIVKE
jgi:hypothetical protein